MKTTLLQPPLTATPARDGQRASRDHALFRQFPLAGEAQLSTGRVPTPYHVYDGHGLFIGGTVDLAAARALLAPEQVVPVRTDEGRALMGVWLFNFQDASLGPHHELQLSLFVSRQELPPVPAHRLSLLELMLTRPEVQMLCHGLWNNTPTVVAYNRELLGLNARLSDSRIECASRAVGFQVRDVLSGQPIVQGGIDRPTRPSLAANLALMSRLGLRRLASLARQPWIRMPVLNTIGQGIDRNAAAESFTKADATALRDFDAKRDHLVFGEPRYRQLDFKPQFTQWMSGMRFVYLSPT